MTEAESALIEAALAYEARWGAQFDSITHVPEDAVGRSVANTARAVRAEREEAEQLDEAHATASGIAHASLRAASSRGS